MKRLNRRNTVLLLTLLMIAAVLVLVACAPRQAGGSADEENSVQAALTLPTWSENSNCESCHTAEVESADDPACIYSLHSSTTCITCHADTDGKLTTAHERYAAAKQPTKLKRISVSSDVCLSCHNLDELKTSTANLAVLVDFNGTTVNPHDLPQTEKHSASVGCSECHKQHKPDAIEDNAKKTCLSCHHADVYECGTCHE